MRVVVTLCGALALLVTACGSPPADLFVVTRSGTIPAAQLTLLVSDDGSVVCNGGPRRSITSDQLITARGLERELEELSPRGLSRAPGTRSVLRYQVRSSEGTVRFSDTSRRQPRVFYELALFTRQIAKGVCKLPR
jgi:hypothetical protein